MSIEGRRKFLKRSAALGAALLDPRAIVQRAARPAKPAQPNVLLIMTDQQRVDTLGYRGLTPCRTPHLDRLAAEGISFDRCVTPSPVCLPARTALFTSRYAHETETMSNQDTLKAEPILLTGMHRRGYQVDYAGKWHMGASTKTRWVDRIEGEDRAVYSRWCLAQGLPDGWAFNDPAMRSHRRDDVSIPRPAVAQLPPEKTNDAWIVDHALELLRTRDRNRPFFLTCCLNGPHPPLKIPEPYFSMYDPAAIPQPPNFGPTPGEPAALDRSFYRTVFRDYGESWENWKKSLAVYWGFVTMIDAQIGRLVEHLRGQGVLDDTLVIMTTDHGEMMGQHGLWQKYQAYEEALRVPLIVRAPWVIEPGIRTEAAASLIDLLPTIFGICGIEPPAEARGVDLSFAFGGAKRESSRRVVFSEFQPKGEWHGVVDWRLVTDNHHKYVWNNGDIEELYDLSSDPQELKNLARSANQRATLEGLRRELRAWMKRTDDPLLSSFDHQQSVTRTASRL